ncbi:putative C2H2-type domain-containing protein [Seiridium unicorne]|uniref:C2H2-type domain-containing protein n=1 Tax=Seiridium unicorne TaxID=138068 RepID=A0ABR2V148_9PEZI
MIAPAVASRKRSFSRFCQGDSIISALQLEEFSNQEHNATMLDSIMQGAAATPAAQSVTTHSRARSRPPPLDKSYRKVPFNVRCNCSITSTHPDFVVMEQYFDRQLRNAHQTVNEILEDHFIPYEIELFVPTKKAPTVNDQRRNTEQYQDLLATTFKDKLPTLACKMAMLYFGLPVAPMKMAPYQGVSESDLAAFDDVDRPFALDPLAFLDEYGEDNLGSGKPRDASINLRGGSLDEDELKLILTDAQEESSEQWEQQANDQLALSLRGGALAYDELPYHSNPRLMTAAGLRFLWLYGRQGSTGIGPKWADFVQGVVGLLGLGAEQKINPDASVYIAVDLWEGGPQSKDYLQTMEGRFYLNPAKYDSLPNDDILTFITNNMNKSHDLQRESRRRTCFVRFTRDKRAPNFRPIPPTANTIRMRRTELQQVTRVYMRTTHEPSVHNRPSQYAAEFSRALFALVPGTQRHYYVDLRFERGLEPVQDCGRIYLGQDPPQPLLNLIAQSQGRLDEIEIIAEVELQMDDFLPILTTARRDLPTTEPGVVGSVDKVQLLDQNAIAEMIVDYCLGGRGTKDSVKYVELYLPSHSFLDVSVEPVLCYYQNGVPVSTADLWVARIDKLKTESGGAVYDGGFAIWGRPVFHEYILINNFDTAAPAQYTLDNLLELDLAAFKSTVSTYLFPQRYDGHNRNDQLFLSTGEQHEEPEHVVRFDTTEHHWSEIKRRIAFDRVRVSLAPEKDKYQLEADTRWELDAGSYWGPCYDVPQYDVNLKTAEAAAAASASVSGLAPATSSSKPAPKKIRYPNATPYPTGMREQVFWKPPSIFSNPHKPLILVNAPPVETLFRVGPRLPAVSSGTRTATEMVQLEQEVHTLRGLILSRNRECPFAGCGRTFPYDDEEALDTHLKEDHALLKCPYCYATGKQGNESGNQLYFQNHEQAMKHFYQNHWKDMLKEAGVGSNNPGFIDNGVPGVVLSNDGKQKQLANYRYCTQCGRDHSSCHHQLDRENHTEKCINMDSYNPLATSSALNVPQYCIYCGVESFGSCPNPSCVAKVATIGTPPEVCCIYCGIPWSSYDTAYQITHKAGCKSLGGKTGDFCGFCGVTLKGMDDIAKRSHADYCNERPRPQAVQCPTCSLDLNSPKEVKDHLRDAHGNHTSCPWCEQQFPAHDRAWTDEVKVQHFAGHMGVHAQIPGIGTASKVHVDDLKCPGFVDCGVIVSNMTSDQYWNHMGESHSIGPQSGKVFYPNGQPVQFSNRTSGISMTGGTQPSGSAMSATTKAKTPGILQAQYEWQFSSAQRPASPDWDSRLPYMPFRRSAFVPTETMRCSRCFTLAPVRRNRNRENEIEIHSDPKLSCGIRRAPGVYDPKTAPVPNRSGWIEFPSGFDFKEVRRQFFAQYPAYRGTLFPVHDDRVDDVFDDPSQSRGQQRDDILASQVTGAAMARHQLPWPPYPGPGAYRNRDTRKTTWIPVPAASSSTATSGAAFSKSAVARLASGNMASAAARVVLGPAHHSPFDEEKADLAMGGVGDVPVAGYDTATEQRKLRFIGTKDSGNLIRNEYNKPEEEEDESPGTADGLVEDIRVLQAEMKALPASFKSPLDESFLRKRSRTPTLESATGFTEADRQLKRIRRGHLISKGSILADGPETRSRNTTPALHDDVEQENATKPKPKATLKAKFNKTALPVTDLDIHSATGAATPSVEEVTTIPPTTTRKSSRTTTSKRVAYKEDDSDESNTDTTVEDGSSAGSVIMKSARTRAKTPAKRGRTKAEEDASTDEKKPAKTPAKTSAKAAAKTPGKTPAKRGRKKADDPGV